MISRAAVVPLQHDAGELRIHNNEVLRKSSVAQQSAIHSCEGRGGVDEIREAANVAIRKKRIRRGKTTQCHGSSQDPAVHHGGADNTRRRCKGAATGARDIESPEQSVEKRCIAGRPRPAIAREVECIEDTVLEDIRFVELRGAEEFRRFVADPAHIQRQVLRQLSLNREAEVLNVWRYAMVVIPGNVRGPIDERNGSKRFYRDLENACRQTRLWSAWWDRNQQWGST